MEVDITELKVYNIYEMMDESSTNKLHNVNHDTYLVKYLCLLTWIPWIASMFPVKQIGTIPKTNMHFKAKLTPQFLLNMFIACNYSYFITHKINV